VQCLLVLSSMQTNCNHQERLHSFIRRLTKAHRSCNLAPSCLLCPRNIGSTLSCKSQELLRCLTTNKCN